MYIGFDRAFHVKRDFKQSYADIYTQHQTGISKEQGQTVHKTAIDRQGERAIYTDRRADNMKDGKAYKKIQVEHGSLIRWLTDSLKEP